MMATRPYRALAGVYDPAAPLGRAEAEALLGRALAELGEPSAAVRDPLAVAVTGNAIRVTGEDGALCAFAGALHGDVAEPPGARDEDVAALAFRRSGEEALQALLGTFVVATWDPATERGLLAQDQLGGMTLFTWGSGSRLYFASELVVLLRMLPRRPAPDPEAVAFLLANDSPPLPGTPYEGIERLGAAHLLELGNGRWRRRRYWQPAYRPPQRLTAGEAADALHGAIDRAVAARLRDHAPTGIVMSGGLDSATIAAAAAEVASRGDGQVLHGYSAVFPSEPRMDESPRIDALAAHLRLPSVQLEIVPQGLVALALDYQRRWELPLTGAGYLIEQPLAARAAADGMQVLIEGQGGNEVFGQSPYLPADRLRRGRLISSVRLARAFPLALYPAPWWQTYAIWKLFALKGALPPGVQQTVRARRPSERYVPAYLAPGPAETYLRRDPAGWKRGPRGPLWWRFKVYLATQIWEEVRTPEYLRHRAFMAGLEARTPLLDRRLVDLALTIPPQLEFDARHDRPLVRRALRGRIPDEVRLWREKSNLGPLYHRAASEADLPAIRRILLAPDAEIRSFTRPDAVERLLSAPPKVGDRGWLGWLPGVWSLLTVELLLRQQADPAYCERALDAPDVQQPRALVRKEPGEATRRAPRRRPAEEGLALHDGDR